MGIKTGLQLAIDCYHCMDYAYQYKHPPIKLAAMASTRPHTLQRNDFFVTTT